MATKKGAPVVDTATALVRTAGEAVEKFTQNLFGFLSTAKALEEGARQTLADARALQAPASREDDEAIKTFARLAAADRRRVEGHWAITAQVHAFHKHLTAARSRATQPLDEAVAIATRLHAAYVEAEERRAREESDRLRREAEARAREAQEREVARLEAEAAAAEEASPDLSEREERFVEAWLATGGNAQEAARRAGYKDAIATAARLTTSQKIKAAIEAKIRIATLRRQAAAEAAVPVSAIAAADVETVEAQADTAGDQQRRSAELDDEQAFVTALLSGQYGIPSDVILINRPKLNEYARQLGKDIERWPGVRFVTKRVIR